MSRIDNLIQDLCPDGVEFGALSDVAAYSNTRVVSTELDADTFVGVDNLLAGKAGLTAATYQPNTDTLTEFLPGDVLIGNIRPYLKKIWLADRRGGCSGDVLAVRVLPELTGKLMPEFLYYVLSSDAFFAYDMQHARGAKMPRGDKKAVLGYPIPVPPVEVQHEIVRVLGLFQSLAAQLGEELNARRRQYEQYRSSLMTSFVGEGVKWLTIGEICTSVASGGTPLASRPAYYGGDIPWLRTQEVRFVEIYDTEIKITLEGLANSSAKWIPADCVIVAISGASAARVGINKIPLTTNQHCCNLEIDPTQASYRYVFHWLANEYERLKALGRGARSDLNSGIIKGYPIAVPSLDAQERLVGILDKFDGLVNDLSGALPAELAARRKQYEYYRDRLLSFEAAA